MRAARVITISAACRFGGERFIEDDIDSTLSRTPRSESDEIIVARVPVAASRFEESDE